MLLLGVLQAQAAGQAAGSFDLLETQVLASSAASVTFSSLSTYAADYQHLQIRAVIGATAANARLWMRLNGTTSGYAWHMLRGNGSSVSSEGPTSQPAIRLINNIGTTSNAYGAAIIDLLDAFDTAKNKTVRSLGGGATGANEINLNSGSSFSTSALDSVTFGLGETTISQQNLATGSRFSLYGIKAA